MSRATERPSSADVREQFIKLDPDPGPQIGAGTQSAVHRVRLHFGHSSSPSSHIGAKKSTSHLEAEIHALLTAEQSSKADTHIPTLYHQAALPPSSWADRVVVMSALSLGCLSDHFNDWDPKQAEKRDKTGQPSLRQRLAAGAITPSAYYSLILKIITDVSQALAHCHARGVLHRDMKAENILLDEEGAYLADFGCARHIDTDERRPLAKGDCISVGTPYYMAPEDTNPGQRGMSIGKSTDLWGLGAVLGLLLGDDDNHDLQCSLMAPSQYFKPDGGDQISRLLGQVQAARAMSSPEGLARRHAKAAEAKAHCQRTLAVVVRDQRLLSAGELRDLLQDIGALLAAPHVARDGHPDDVIRPNAQQLQALLVQISNLAPQVTINRSKKGQLVVKPDTAASAKLLVSMGTACSKRRRKKKSVAHRYEARVSAPTDKHEEKKEEEEKPARQLPDLGHLRRRPPQAKTATKTPPPLKTTLPTVSHSPSGKKRPSHDGDMTAHLAGRQRYGVLNAAEQLQAARKLLTSKKEPAGPTQVRRSLP